MPSLRTLFVMTNSQFFTEVLCVCCLYFTFLRSVVVHIILFRLEQNVNSSNFRPFIEHKYSLTMLVISNIPSDFIQGFFIMISVLRKVVEDEIIV